MGFFARVQVAGLVFRKKTGDVAEEESIAIQKKHLRNRCSKVSQRKQFVQCRNTAEGSAFFPCKLAEAIAVAAEMVHNDFTLVSPLQNCRGGFIEQEQVDGDGFVEFSEAAD